MSLPARQVSAPITPNAACAYSPRTTRPLRGLFSPLGMGRPKFTIGWQLSSRPKETRLAAASRSVIPSRRENTHVRSAALVREDAYSQKRIISGSRTTRRPPPGSAGLLMALADPQAVVRVHQETRGIGRSLARESGEGLHDPVGHVREGLRLPPHQAAAERTPYSRLLQQTDEVGAPAPVLIRQAEGLIEGDVGGDLQLRGGVAEVFVADQESRSVG